MSLNIPDVTKAHVIYHFPCMDGFASAYAFHELKEKDYWNVKYIPANYPASIAYIPISDKDTDVYVLDFSFSREDIKIIAECANKVILLDHHKTAQADLENWEDKPDNVEIVFDMFRSGAKITWDYFKKDPDKESQLIEYVSDRDLWKFALVNSKAINAVVANTPYAFDRYKELDSSLDVAPVHLKQVGVHLMNQHQKFCEEMIEDAREIVFKDYVTGEEYAGLAVNTTYQFASEVGNLLAKQSGSFGATYYSTKDGSVKFSLRSIGDYDVSRIAKHFGGGGHRNAAGFTLAPNETDRTAKINVWTYGPEYDSETNGR